MKLLIVPCVFNLKHSKNVIYIIHSFVHKVTKYLITGNFSLIGST